jgi:hypothetical protein
VILDNETMFSKAQGPITATAGSTDIVDLGSGDIGPSERVSLFVVCNPPFTGAGTVTIELHTADAATAGALTSPVVAAAYAVANAALRAGGKLVSARLPHGMKRYARLNYVVSASATLAAGKLTAGLALDIPGTDPV